MSELPLLFAFSAGMAASVNPCGFIMLPALIAFMLGDAPDAAAEPALRRAGRGLLVGLATTVGFVGLFAVVGFVLALGGRALVTLFPWAGLAVGVGLVLTGVWLLATGHALGLPLAARVRLPLRRGLGGGLLFGVAYGAASLGCTLPIFLIVVGQALAAEGLVAALGQFVAYALGMGFVLLVVSLATALVEDAMLRISKAVVPLVQRLGALLLIAAGGYLVQYWWPLLGALR
jgi:cytochrome c biogenesis protein CcdA